jgi:hypothetical protein
MTGIMYALRNLHNVFGFISPSFTINIQIISFYKMVFVIGR